MEVGDGSYSRVWVIRMSRIADGAEICSHEIDKHSVVGDLEQCLAIDLEDSCSESMMVIEIE